MADLLCHLSFPLVLSPLNARLLCSCARLLFTTALETCRCARDLQLCPASCSPPTSGVPPRVLDCVPGPRSAVCHAQRIRPKRCAVLSSMRASHLPVR
eukprot:919769-Pleurochrysis_carterae.AAC.1